MKSKSHAFKQQAADALVNVSLQKALLNAKDGFIVKRKKAMDELPEFERLRTKAIEIKEHTLSHLDQYLEYFEQQVIKSGGTVHWASTTTQAQQIIVELCKQANARTVTKGKSMVGEEAAINDALEAAGFEAIETDLGEYIIQLANEPPSHIIAPAIHKSKQEIADLFKDHHKKYNFNSKLETIPEIVNEAREVLREKFINADVGITGANFLVAETGSTLIVTNEGNGDLTATLPKTHIVISSIEKVVPTLEDTSVLLRLLARSATGQEITSYTTFFNGPKRNSDIDGPENFHVVLLDNGRSNMLQNENHEMLKCIHCGACLNHCPVYSAIGGHAYGWVYPGPMGSVLTPIMQGLDEAKDLPFASTFCGRCEEVCPLSIPLPKLLRQHRNHIHHDKLNTSRSRLGLALWAFVASRPALYRPLSNSFIRALGWLGKKSGRFSWLPFASAWTQSKDLPAPAAQSFMSAWTQQQAKKKSSENE
ncbi:MAG: LutB/LldF family L-lactate oxidation iron-sulfur protein [Gammaproteobacteria bacterium]|nr:LutB/LldF family L-lactate oxidation iron-sulfur protein [Gammaproteobacteria bacterium]